MSRKTIKLKADPGLTRGVKVNNGNTDKPILKSKPFAEATRAKLAHRVRYLTLYEKVRLNDHYAVSMWCGSSTCRTDIDDLGLTDQPSRLLCERCEAMAVLHGQPTSDELAGRHVHTGRLVPKQTCCQEERESN